MMPGVIFFDIVLCGLRFLGEKKTVLMNIIKVRVSKTYKLSF